MLKVLFLSTALLAATVSAGEAANKPKTGPWHILQNTGTGQCIGTRMPPSRGLAMVGGKFPTQQAAEAAIPGIPRCLPYLRMIGKSPFWW